jgi:DNA-binding MarR family transcriptional regulator
VPEDDSLPELFRLVNRRLRYLARESLEPWDITPAQSRALGVLLRGGPLRLSDLAERLRIVPRSTTEVVDALEAAGLAGRSPDPADRRATLVTLTPRGTEVAESARAARAAGAERLFDTLSPADRADLARILKTLTAGDPL